MIETRSLTPAKSETYRSFGEIYLVGFKNSISKYLPPRDDELYKFFTRIYKKLAPKTYETPNRGYSSWPESFKPYGTFPDVNSRTTYN